MEERNSKDRILHCARELFQKYGVRSISMDDIAQQLGISKKTIYQHFADKDDIVYLVMRHVIGEQKQALTALRAEASDIIEQVVRIHAYIQEKLDNTTASLLHDLQKYHAKAWKLVTDFKYGFLRELMVAHIQEGIEQGLFREDVHSEILSRVRLEEVEMANNEAIFPRHRYDNRVVANSMLEHFILGISTDRGKRLYNKYKSHNDKRTISSTLK